MGMARKRWVVLTVGLVLATYLTLSTVTQQGAVPEVKGKEAAPVANEEYTLPSLEEVIQSVRDQDVQRVLRMYSTQHEEVPPGTAPAQVIVSSTWRSGSTLLGEILAAHPGAYYHYEPLMPYGQQQIAPGKLQDEVLDLLRGILSCNYHKLEEYLKFAFVNHDIFLRNTRLWSMCSAMPRSKCYNPDTLGRLCSLFPIHVMKVVRARLELLAPLLKDPKMRIVWLVRDPRAVMSSRYSSITWCETRSCKDPGYLCSDLRADLSTYMILKEEYPSQVMLLRYEDLAQNPYDKSRQVLEFARLTFHQRVRDYLDDHLTSDEDEPWSTRHDPRTRISRWRKLLRFEEMIKVQYHCRDIMKSLGYRPFSTTGEMSNGNAIGILNLP